MRLIQGDADQIVPIEGELLRSAKLLKHATLKVYPDVPHGLCAILADRVNAALLGFIKA